MKALAYSLVPVALIAVVALSGVPKQEVEQQTDGLVGCPVPPVEPFIVAAPGALATKQRKDINSLTPAELADYIHAIIILRQRSATDPDDVNGYDYQADLHNDLSIGPCEHGNDLFLPWHRLHLHYFEQLLQATDPPRTTNVTIPYWDFMHTETGANKFPAAFYRTGLSRVDRNEVPGTLPQDIMAILNESDWNEFGGYPRNTPGRDYGRFEEGPHNDMHGTYIGGPMANPATAAQDAIYWSFHCFIDLVWSEWQKRHGDPDMSSPDMDLRGFAGQPLHRVHDVRSIEALGYEYALNPLLTAAFASEPPPPALFVLSSTSPVRKLFVDPAEELGRVKRLQFAIPTTSLPSVKQVIRLNALEVPIRGSYRLEAYVHPRSVSFAPEDEMFKRTYYAGYVSMWRGHTHIDQHADHHVALSHPSTANARFDVTDALHASGDIGEAILSLRYVPALGPQGQTADVPGLVQEVRMTEVVLETYVQP